MDIRQINPNNELSKNSAGKTNKSSKPENSSPANSSSVNKSNTVKGDSVSLSSAKFASEIDFARTTLDKLNTENLSSLKKIKQNIKQGAYTNENVHNTIGSRIKDDLKSLSILLRENLASSSSEQISTEQKEFLLNNDKVLEDISNKIFDNLNKI